MFLSKNKYFNAILITQIWTVIILFLAFIGFSSKLITLIGYLAFFLSTIFFIVALIFNHKNPSFVTAIFLLWICYLLIDAIPFLFNNYRNYIYFKQFISGRLFLYIIPFIIISNLNLVFYKSLLKFSYKLLVLYLILTFLLFFYLIQDKTNGGEALTLLMGGAAPLMMTLPYHKTKYRIIILLAVILLLFEMMILGRRNVVLYFGCVFFSPFFMSLLSKEKNQKNLKRNFLRLFILAVSFSGFIFWIFSNSFDFFLNRVQTGMQSREIIIELFINDFNNAPKDWILGRGIFGQFQGAELASDTNTGLRDGIENGYLQLILKGGWVYLGLLILISINAIYKGLFKSKNYLVKGFAAIIVIYYIDMIGFGVPTLSIKYIMVFIAIAGCNTLWLRECSDEYLATELGLR
jgi:hypothetical protein